MNSTQQFLSHYYVVLMNIVTDLCSNNNGFQKVLVMDAVVSTSRVADLLLCQ
jgi:hypothetical protein